MIIMIIIFIITLVSRDTIFLSIGENSRLLHLMSLKLKVYPHLFSYKPRHWTKPPDYSKWVRAEGKRHSCCSDMLVLGHISSIEPTVYISFQFCNYLGSWKLAMMGMFTPQKSANTANQGFVFPPRELAVKYLPARHRFEVRQARVWIFN